MSWVRIDSGLWRDPRWRSLSAGARALFVDLLGISGDRDSDGALDRTAFVFATVDLAPDEAARLAAELVKAGFLEVAGPGWQIVAPFDYLRPRSEVEAERRQRAEAAALGGAERGRTGTRGPDGKYIKPAAPAENPAARVDERVERVDQPTDQPQASPVTGTGSLKEGTYRSRGKDGQPTWADTRGPEWAPLRETKALEAWHDRFRHPPTEAQLPRLVSIAQSDPGEIAEWVRDAPPGPTFGVVEYVTICAGRAKDAAAVRQTADRIATERARRDRLSAQPATAWPALTDILAGSSAATFAAETDRIAAT